MKIIYITLFFFSFTCFSFAKKVKFAVDLTGQPISPNGVHITGDFQEIAGFPGGDWTSDGTPLTQEGTSSIYSIISEREYLLSELCCCIIKEIVSALSPLIINDSSINHCGIPECSDKIFQISPSLTNFWDSDCGYGRKYYYSTFAHK